MTKGCRCPNICFKFMARAAGICSCWHFRPRTSWDWKAAACKYVIVSRVPGLSGIIEWVISVFLCFSNLRHPTTTCAMTSQRRSLDCFLIFWILINEENDSDPDQPFPFADCQFPKQPAGEALRLWSSFWCRDNESAIISSHYSAVDRPEVSPLELFYSNCFAQLCVSR